MRGTRPRVMALPGWGVLGGWSGLLAIERLVWLVLWVDGAWSAVCATPFRLTVPGPRLFDPDGRVVLS